MWAKLAQAGLDKPVQNTAESSEPSFAVTKASTQKTETASKS